MNLIQSRDETEVIPPGMEPVVLSPLNLPAEKIPSPGAIVESDGRPSATSAFLALSLLCLIVAPSSVDGAPAQKRQQRRQAKASASQRKKVDRPPSPAQNEAVKTGKEPPQVAPSPEMIAKGIAEAWLGLLDQKKFSESWEELSPVIKAQFSQNVWATRIENQRKQFGDQIVSRSFQSSRHFKSEKEIDKNGPDLEAMILLFKGGLTGGRLFDEAVNVVSGEDGKWRVYMYAIRRKDHFISWSELSDQYNVKSRALDNLIQVKTSGEILLLEPLVNFNADKPEFPPKLKIATGTYGGVSYGGNLRATGLTCSIVNQSPDPTPDPRFYAAMGVGTALSLPKEWINIFGVSLKGGTLEIRDSGIVISGETEMKR